MERTTSTNRLVVMVLQSVFVLLVAIDYEALFKHFKEKQQIRRLRIQKEEV